MLINMNEVQESTSKCAVFKVLEELGMGVYYAAFQEQRIDNLQTCKLLSDNELKSMGLQTIGERVKFREKTQRSIDQFEGTRSMSITTARERVSQLFRPTRFNGSQSTSCERKKERTWTGTFVCLADKNASKPPSSHERIMLQNAGLGTKKVQFKISDTEEVVFSTLTGSKGFILLANIGGFELLHCKSNCRELRTLDGKWDVAYLKQTIGNQAKIYIRPIQKSIKIPSLTDTSQKNTTQLKDECDICHESVFLSDMRQHIVTCTQKSGTDTEVLEIAQTLLDTPVIEIKDQEMLQEKAVTLLDTINEIVEHCKQKNISDPVEILQICQSQIVLGRPLEIQNEEECIDGTTNFILVDRDNLLTSSIEEIKGLDNLRYCLEVQFYGETAVDYGGPRKEFFAEALREMKERFFEPVREWSKDYKVLGQIMALSLLQNGKLPKVMSVDLVEEVFRSDNPRPFAMDIRKGLNSLGIYELVVQLPILIHLFTPKAHRSLTFKMINSILKPSLSDEGSNRRKRESTVYSLFLKYMREVASGRRNAVNLGMILKFTTGSDEEPLLGYQIQPMISFVESQTYLPTSNTCINRLYLTVPEMENELPDTSVLYNMYDYAFCNSYFGLQ